MLGLAEGDGLEVGIAVGSSLGFEDGVRVECGDGVETAGVLGMPWIIFWEGAPPPHPVRMTALAAAIDAKFFFIFITFFVFRHSIRVYLIVVRYNVFLISCA